MDRRMQGGAGRGGRGREVLYRGGKDIQPCSFGTPARAVQIIRENVFAWRILYFISRDLQS